MRKTMVISVLVLGLSGFGYATNEGNGQGNGGPEDGGGSQVGPQGPAGVQGPAGARGKQGNTGLNGVNGTNGVNATETVNRALKGELDVRLMDTKHTSLYVFDSYGFDDSPTHDTVMDGRNSSYGFKFVVKLGKSYEEQRIDELQKLVVELKKHAH